MKIPSDLAPRWARQWENSNLREARLLDENAWPAALPIVRPTPTEIASSWQETARRIRVWRELRNGSVRWETITYRATGDPVKVPVAWEVSSANEWVTAANDRNVRAEYDTLRRILDGTDPIFHATLVRERSLWKKRTSDETIRAAQLAMQLSPGCAQGKPLRAISLAGIDSKFFEVHYSLILRFLDLRFDGEASRQGLEAFLNAWRESDHWLLLADLGHSGALVFSQLRVRADELATKGLAARALLIIENEKCLHLLPPDLPGVIAVLGCGNNLVWLRSSWVQQLPVGYWGDIDTWGLTLLARARDYAPNIVPMLMTRETFDIHSDSAVVEKIPASSVAPDNLTPAEKALYSYVLNRSCGRLEQEFLPATFVYPVINSWAAGKHCGI